MVKRARIDDDATTPPVKRARRDDANNEKMINKARYGTKGHYCHELFPILERAKQLNNGVEPPSRSFYTSTFPHQNEWSMDNLPEILFYIKPTPVDKDANRRRKMRGDNLNILDSAVVPDYVSVDVPEWLVGAWLRLDPTLNLSDIRARMSEDEYFIGGKIDKPAHSALNNRLFRKCAKVFCHWDSSSKNKNQRDIRKQLTDRNIELNTILDETVVAGERRLVKKTMKRKSNGTQSVQLLNVHVTDDNYLETTFPIDHFKLAGEDHQTPALTDGSTPASAGEEEAATPAPVLAPIPVPLLAPVSSPVLAPVDFTVEDNDAFIKRLDQAMEETQALINPSVVPLQAVGPSAPTPLPSLEESLSAFEPLDWTEFAAVPDFVPAVPVSVPAAMPAQATDSDDDDEDNEDNFAATKGDNLDDFFDFNQYENDVLAPAVSAAAERNGFDDLLDEYDQAVAATLLTAGYSFLPPTLPSESSSSSASSLSNTAPSSLLGCDLDFGQGPESILPGL